MVDVEDLKRIVIAWGRWDAKPGSADTAGEMVDACNVVAERLGLTKTPIFRITMTTKYRELRDHKEAVKAAVLELGGDWERETS